MPDQIYFTPNGSSQRHPVNSRKEILDILREKQPSIFTIDIVLQYGIYHVLAIFKNDVSWFGVGTTTSDI